jgi:hypothetical protein
MVGSDPHVSGTALEQGNGPLHDRAYSGMRAGAQRLRQPMMLTKELIGAVYKVNAHS